MREKATKILAIVMLFSAGLFSGCSQEAADPSPESLTAELNAEAQPEPTKVLSGVEEASRPEPDATVPPIDPDVQAQRFVDLMASGDFDTAVGLFDATMLDELPAATLQDVWETLIAQVGSYQGQLGTRSESQAPYEIIYVVIEFEQADVDAQVVFGPDGQIAGLFFNPSQGLAEAEPYSLPGYLDLEAIEELEVMVGSGDWPLPASLTLPLEGSDLPAVVLVHGSGPHDRDESIGPNKPFRDLAWGLASQGVAVLRYEKRTSEYPERIAGMMQELTVYEETIEDALAAVDLLRNMDRINPERIFVLGHSLGGMLAPRIGALDPGIGGLIVLAGTSRPLEDVILEQVTYVLGVDGDLSDLEQEQLAEVEQQVMMVKDPELSATVPYSDMLMAVPASYWLDLRGYDPAGLAAELDLPMLILQGGRDYQVTEVDFEGWQSTLLTREDVTFKFYPQMSHLFIEGEGVATPAEYQIAGHVAEKVVFDIIDWIEQN